MDMIVSEPKVPAAPERASYPVTELQLFARLTRASYYEKYGRQAPAWDKNRRIKRWFDTSVLEGLDTDPAEVMVSYEVFDAGAGRVRKMQISALEASTPNLPGQFAYPKFTVAPTMAVMRSSYDGSEAPLNPSYLCERSEAVQMARELGVEESAVRETEFGGPWRVVWNGESRRLWTVAWRGERLQASALLAQKHAAGIGAPGHWETNGAEPVWIAEVAGETGEMDPRPEMLIPVRRLGKNEKLQQGFGGIWTVVREDLRPLTVEEMLQRIDHRTAKLAEHLQVEV
jgi:hypothetical protein